MIGHFDAGPAQFRAEKRRAIEEFRALVDLAPDDPETRIHLAQAWLAAGEPEEALRCARQVLERAPDFVPAVAEALSTRWKRS